MHRIDTSTAQADKFGVGKNGFTGGNPQTGQLPTELDEDFFDAVQEELCSVIEDAGMAPVKGANGQLLAAIKQLLQPLNGNLTAFAGVSGSQDKLTYFTAPNTLALTALTSVGREIIAKTSTADVLAYLGLGDGSLIPVGVPMPYFGATPPTGWIKCNGSSFSATTYPKLALAYPSLVLPDLRANVIRGWDDGRGIDSDRVLLSEQSDAIRNITGSMCGYDRGGDSSAQWTGAMSYVSVTSSGAGSGVAGGEVITTFDASLVVPTASENRMRNISFNYIVRAT